jgi:hypothetical protein
MPSEARIFWLAGRLASALLLLAGPHALAAGPDIDPARRIKAVRDAARGRAVGIALGRRALFFLPLSKKEFRN